MPALRHFIKVKDFALGKILFDIIFFMVMSWNCFHIIGWHRIGDMPWCKTLRSWLFHAFLRVISPKISPPSFGLPNHWESTTLGARRLLYRLVPVQQQQWERMTWQHVLYHHEHSKCKPHSVVLCNACKSKISKGKIDAYLWLPRLP